MLNGLYAPSVADKQKQTLMSCSHVTFLGALG